jgi:methyl-accepting chemotaxis protein
MSDTVTLEFLAAQQRRLLDEMALFRTRFSVVEDDIRVLSAMAIRQDNTTKAVLEHIARLYEQSQRTNEEMRRMNERLSEEMRQMDERLSGEMRQMNERLSGEMRHLGGEMRQMNERLSHMNERLTSIEARIQ